MQRSMSTSLLSERERERERERGREGGVSGRETDSDGREQARVKGAGQGEGHEGQGGRKASRGSADSSRHRDTTKAHLEGNPLLLYYTSVDLLNTVDPTFARIIAEYWEDKLGLRAGGFAEKLPTDQQESRRLVFSLITSGVPRGGVAASPVRPDSHSRAARDSSGGGGGGAATTLRGDASAASAASGLVASGKKIALASEGHLRLLAGIIQKETHFSQETIYVEETNFESVLLKLKRASPTSLTFIFVHITGRVSADQINHLVAAPASTIKLIFQYSQSLVNLLEMTPSNRDLIHRPESISVTLRGKMRAVPYSPQSAVGAMVLYNSERLASNPREICSSGLYWDADYLNQMIRAAERWKDTLTEWIESPVEGEAGPAEFLRILVTPDHHITAHELEQCLQAREQPVRLRVVDAGERSKIDELRSFVDSRSAPGFSFSRMRHADTRPTEQEDGEVAAAQRVSEVFILRNATFLPHARLEVLVSRCCSRRTKLILLVGEASSSISRFRVMKDPSSPPVWVRVPILSQRLLRNIPTLRHRLAFMGLQLLFSQEAVVSDKHFDAVERSLEAAPPEANALEFLDHVEGFPLDRLTRVALIHRLANTDDDSVVTSDVLLKKASLAEILALHLNRYLRFPLREGAAQVSFADFCRQPRARFLSQVHRIEAFISYLFSETEVSGRFGAKSDPNIPLGLPLAACFSGLVNNVHCSSSPGHILSTKFDKDWTSLCEAQCRAPDPHYVDPGRGDVVTHMQEIAEHQAVVGAELNWEEMARKWESGPEITDEVLDHILIHSPGRLSVLLCMTPPQIVYLSLSSQALNAILMDFENCQESLRSVPQGKNRTLRTRAAAIWWLLLTKGAHLRRSSEETFAEDQSLLLDSGIYIEPGSEQLLSRVTMAMLPLDRPDTFTGQHAVRDFVLSNSNSALIASMMDDEAVRIGQGFVNACVARETLNGILAGTIGNAVFSKMGNIFRWLKDSGSANVENMRAESQVLATRLTPKAVACLLSSANPPVDLRKARNGILHPYISSVERILGTDEAKRFLGGILTPFCTARYRGLAVGLFDALAAAERQNDYIFPVPDLEEVPQAWTEIFKAMSASATDTSIMSTMLNCAIELEFSLPLEASAKLCAMYVNHFSADGRNANRDLEDHIVLLKLELGQAAIYEYMTGPSCEEIPLNPSTFCLLWFCWWSRPWTSFPLRFLPKPETWSLFQSVARKVELRDETVRQGLSTIARFARAPHTLPASMVNALKCAMVDGKPLILSEKYVLAQLGSKTYPVYGFRSHKRHLPRPCIQSIIQEMQKRSSLTGFAGRDQTEVFKALFPVTDSGVSIETVRKNLSILVHIDQSPESLESNRTAEMRAQIFLPTLAWFFSAGFSIDDLKAVCSAEERGKLIKNNREMAAVWRKPTFATAVVYCPLPVYVDVRYVTGKVGSLFQCNAESVNNTVQWLAMLQLEYRLAGCDAAQEFFKYAQDRNAGRNADLEFPKVLVTGIMLEIAKVIARRHRNVELGGSAAGKFHSVPRGADEVQQQARAEQQRADSCSAVVDSCVPLADFFAQIRSSSQSFARPVIDGLASGLQEARVSQDLQVYVADALYMLIGVTPLNSGIEVTHMLEAWRTYDLTIGSSVIMEIEYMATNIYKERGLEKLANTLLEQINAKQPLRQIRYVRNPANIPLASALDEPNGNDTWSIYTYNDLPLIPCPHAQAENENGDASIPVSQRVPSIANRSSLRAADFDHARTSSFRGHFSARLPQSSPSALGMSSEVELFKSAASDCTGEVFIKNSRNDHRIPRGFSTTPRTISARDFVSVDSGPPGELYSGYAVIRILPGLHPVLRSPGDAQNIPVSQQKSLGKGRGQAIGRDSFDREDNFRAGHSKIEAIFSNNGGTWENLCHLPTGSTIMGKGFYLRKSYEGWVFLMGATRCSNVDSKPYILWSLLDTMKLAALDFASTVMESLKGLLCLAYSPEDVTSHLEDAAFQKVLDKIRSWYWSARSSESGNQQYLEYLTRECTVCKHLLQVMKSIPDDETGSSILQAFQRDQLESKLKVRVNSTEAGVNYIVQQLAQFVPIRDWVPRSQFVFTLELVLAHHPSHRQDISPHTAEIPAGSERVEPDPKIDFEEDVIGGFDLFEDDQDQTRQGSAARRDLSAVNCSVQNKLIAAHEHITQDKFHRQSLGIIRDIQRRRLVANSVEWTIRFDDSDEEEEANTADMQGSGLQRRGEEDRVVDDAHRERIIGGDQQSSSSHYVDDEIDMPRSHESQNGRQASPLFPGTWGYGRQICSKFCVPSVLGDYVPLYFVQMDVRRLKIGYSDSEGLPIAFLFHKRLLDRSLKAFRAEDASMEASNPSDSPSGDYSQNVSSSDLKSEDQMLAYREELLRWLTDLVRSPLPNAAKDWFLDKLENGATTRCVPSLTIHESESGRSAAHLRHSTEHVGGDLNLVVIAHCIAVALPAPNECKPLFRNAYHVPPGFHSFCSRKNDLYGIHIVRGGTLQELLDRGAVVEVCNLGYDALIRSKDNASMYLSIISHFSTFTWLVYVTGLDHIDDALLKWLAEYTKAHPWRFIYLENTQTSWNFAENRDRCVYERAPPPVERNIRTEMDLKNPEVSSLRPTHNQPYPRIRLQCSAKEMTEETMCNMSWEDIESFIRSFFSNAAATPDGEDPSRQATESDTESDIQQRTDYRIIIRSIFNENCPCVVLLCSPPGAGKSHFSNELAEMLKREHSLGRAFIDGSDDRFVDMSLTEILEVELPDPSKSQFLIVDEFHMLKENHKQDLFRWLEVNGRRLHVLLIANRKDANDEKLLYDLKRKGATIGIQQDRIRHFSTRLGNALLQEVMRKRKTDPSTQDKISRWMHCSRCLFGGEAVSLRGISGLQDRLKGLEARLVPEYELVNLLLDKVPTVSETTAREFVLAFLASLVALDKDSCSEAVAAVAQKVKGPVSLMVQAALLTENKELVGDDFPDFVSYNLERAYDAPPALRIAAWCCHIRKLAENKDGQDAMDPPSCAFQSVLVDQCGFPLQLEDSGARKLLSEGPAFSWGGDYSRMKDIIDAVRHGHSVDWADVHNRCWSCEPVQDSSLLVELLSVCTSPGKVLEALTRDNLCALLKKSSPDDSLHIALEVLRWRTGHATCKSDGFLSPYRTAVWMTICYDKALCSHETLLERLGSKVGGNATARSLETEPLDWREDSLADALVWASTHMGDMLTCRHDDDPRRCTALLRQALSHLTRRLMAAGDAERSPRLWGGKFAPLLYAKPDTAARSGGGGRVQDADLLMHVALHAADANSHWGDPVPALWAIAHGRGTAAQVADVWEAHQGLLLVGDGPLAPVHPRLAAGILCVSGVIPTDLQLALLTRNGDVDLELLGDGIEHAAGLVRGAAESLARGEAGEAGLRLAAGPFRQQVLKEMRQFREDGGGNGDDDG